MSFSFNEEQAHGSSPLKSQSNKKKQLVLLIVAVAALVAALLIALVFGGTDYTSDEVDLETYDDVNW